MRCLTVRIGRVEVCDESPNTSKFVELLDTLCSAKFHQFAELLERNTIARGRRHGVGFDENKKKLRLRKLTGEVDLKVASN